MPRGFARTHLALVPHTMSEPVRMKLTKGGESISMSFTLQPTGYYASDCGRYTVSVIHTHCARPFTAWARPPHNNPDKDGARPMAENLGAFEQLKGRDSAIAACIRHKRTQPIECQGAVSVLKATTRDGALATEETGNDRPAAPISTTTQPTAAA